MTRRTFLGALAAVPAAALLPAAGQAVDVQWFDRALSAAEVERLMLQRTVALQRDIEQALFVGSGLTVGTVFELEHVDGSVECLQVTRVV